MAATGALVFLLVLLFMVLGVPVAFAFLAANIIGALLIMGGFEGLLQLVDNSTSLITSFTLVAIPMFVLSNLLLHKGLRVPIAAVRGFWSRIARIMLIIADLATCAFCPRDYVES